MNKMADKTNDLAKRVWIYCRTSHDDRISLSLQESHLKEFAECQDWAVAGISYGIRIKSAYKSL